MEYYKLLQLNREPFSNSPDPEYFFNSRQHMGCLQKLELALRLKRGLNVIIGDVGTGKTTLCRQLIRKFSTESDIETHLILDPSFDSSQEFLKSVLGMICPSDIGADLSLTEMKEVIKRTLFKSGVDENKTIVLIIDEGQKISDPCLEILRELLNYETNTYKLLQIVIFAQLEFNEILQKHANFADRINLCHHLEPLSFSDTRQLIRHRLKLSSTTSKPIALFTLPALWAIYRASRGYPRKIIHLCHQSILALIIQNQSKAGWALIQSCKNRLGGKVPSKRNLIMMTSLTLILILLSIVFAPVIKSRLRESSLPTSFKIEEKKKELPVVISEVDKDVIAPQEAEAPPAETTTGSAAAMTVPIENPSEAAIDLSRNNTAPLNEGASDVIATPPLPDSQNSPPEILGMLVVRPGDTMSDMTLQVYGTRQNRFLRSVIDANPQINDPNDINIGQTINFPSQPINLTAPNKDIYMVVLSHHQNLETAIQELRKLSVHLKPKPKLVTTWSPTQGLRFQLVLPNNFTDTNSALMHIDQLSNSVTTDAMIFSGWPTETVFFSDPFQNNQKTSFIKTGIKIEE